MKLSLQATGCAALPVGLPLRLRWILPLNRGEASGANKYWKMQTLLHNTTQMNQRLTVRQ